MAATTPDESINYTLSKELLKRRLSQTRLAELSGVRREYICANIQGWRRLTREHCDLLVRLPMLGAVESLNVSVATGICLYAALGQRPAGKLASDTGFD